MVQRIEHAFRCLVTISSYLSRGILENSTARSNLKKRLNVNCAVTLNAWTQIIGMCFCGRSFRVTFALNAMCSATYFVEKLKAEKRIIWGLGQDKKLLQYRLPDSISQWTGPDAVPMNPHYGFTSHHRPGVALCTCFPPIPMAADYEQKKVCCRHQFV